jgi:flagellar M-ring protein FliF
VGKGHSVVQVSADLNYDNVKSETKTYLQPSPSAPPLSQSTTTERYAGNGTTVVGVLGPDNSAVPMPSGTASAGGYYKGTNTQDNPYGTNVTDTTQAPGSVRQEHVAVLLDTATAGTVNPTDVQNLVSNAVGLDPKRGDTIQVTRMAFNNAAASQAKQELAAAAKAQSRATQLKMAKTGGLVLFLLLVVLLTWLRSKKARRTQVDPVELARLEELERRNAQLELETRRAAALESNDRLALTSGQEQDPSAEELTRMRDDIGELVDKQPEEVAQLLRGWLADRRS